jgi:hypothetical protein
LSFDIVAAHNHQFLGIQGSAMQRFGPDLSERELRALARERMDAGDLPVVASKSIHAGYGSGNPCSVCGHGIATMQIEYDVMDPRTRRYLMFHLVCHSLWQLECLQALREQAASEHPGTADPSDGARPAIGR